MLKKLMIVFVSILVPIVVPANIEAASQIKLGVLRFASPAELLKEADAIHDIFIKRLSASNAINVLHRSKIDKALNTEADINALSDFGKSERCRYILLGSVNKDKDIVINVRIIDVDTAKVMFSESEASYSQKISSLSVAASKLGDRVRQKLTGEYPRVSSVNGKDIVIDIGSSSGVKKGDLYRVYEEQNEALDKDGNTAGRFTLDLAVIEVKSVKKASSTANLFKNAGDSEIIPELRYKRIESVTKEEAAKLIRQGTFLIKTINAKRESHSQYHIATELNPNKPSSWSQDDFDRIQRLAEKGHPEAQFWLGNEYLGDRNFALALKWFQEAAKQGNSKAQGSLGYMYGNGLGVPQDYQKAFDLLVQSATQAYAVAQNNLGYMYQEGRGVEQDYKKALYWYQKAADQGYWRGQTNLAVMYFNGLGVEQDYRKAIFWLQKAADENIINAKLMLGETYAVLINADRIQYVRRNSQAHEFLNLSREWYQKALEQGQQEQNLEAIRRATDELEKLSNIAVK